MKEGIYMRKFDTFITCLFFFMIFSIFIALDLYSNKYNFIPVYIIFLILLILCVCTDILYGDNISKKPVKCVKAKLIKKTSQTAAVYYGVFLLLDGSKIKLRISLYQYLYFNKNDNVTLMYQGWVAHSIKKDTDKIPFFNGEYDSGKKFAKYALKYPIQSTKAKVLSKGYGDCVIFLLPDNKSVIEMTVSKKQYKALKKWHTFDIIYQGWILHYIKKDEYEKPIFNEDFSSKKTLMGYMSKKINN